MFRYLKNKDSFNFDDTECKQNLWIDCTYFSCFKSM